MGNWYWVQWVTRWVIGTMITRARAMGSCGSRVLGFRGGGASVRQGSAATVTPETIFIFFREPFNQVVSTFKYSLGMTLYA